MAFWSPQSESSNPNKFKLLASTQACVGPEGYEFIMGGVAQAAAIEAAEIACSKPLLWSTIQFVNAGLLNQSIDIDVELLGGWSEHQPGAGHTDLEWYGTSNPIGGTRRSPGS